MVAMASTELKAADDVAYRAESAATLIVCSASEATCPDLRATVVACSIQQPGEATSSGVDCSRRGAAVAENQRISRGPNETVPADGKHDQPLVARHLLDARRTR